MGIKYYDYIWTSGSRDYNHYAMNNWVHYYGSTTTCQNTA